MTRDLKVVYVVGSMEIKRNMNQSELSELLKNDDVVLLSVNEPTTGQYRKKKRT